MTGAPGSLGHMLFRRAADAVAVSHLSLIGFLLAGGFVARGRPSVTKAHLAALAATAAVYAGGFDCPLTVWEKDLRQLAGDQVYRGGYIEHYLVSPFHPGGMSTGIGLAFLGTVVATTAIAYRDRLQRLVRPPATGRA
jgi:hypothetical protein